MEMLGIVGVYLSMLMAETSMSIMLTVWVLRLHHVGPDQAEMSAPTRRLLLCWLARLVGSSAPSVDIRHRTRRSDSTGYRSTRGKRISRYYATLKASQYSARLSFCPVLILIYSKSESRRKLEYIKQ